MLCSAFDASWGAQIMTAMINAMTTYLQRIIISFKIRGDPLRSHQAGAGTGAEYRRGKDVAR